MNKKQAYIIMTLVVLIVCAGYFATKINGPWYSMTDAGTNTSSIKTGDKTGSKTDFFTESRMSREQNNQTAAQTLKNLIDDPNTPKEKKDEASKKSLSLVETSQKQEKIETMLKGKGYEESLCYVEDNKVKVIVRVKDKLSDNDVNQIKNIVMDVAKIKNIEIEPKQ